MRYRWDDEHGGRGAAGRVLADGVEVARTGADFWGSAPRLTIGDDAWAFRIEREGLVGALGSTDEHGTGAVDAAPGIDRLGIARGRIWESSWPMAGLAGPLRLERTTSWLLGKLHFDVLRGGARIAEVIAEGPWQYRPSLEVSGELAHAEAVFLLWAAYRIDARRPLRRIRPGGIVGGGAGGGV